MTHFLQHTHKYAYCLFALLLCLSACQKERFSLPLQALVTPTDAPLYDLHFTHPDTGYAVGGQQFFHGEWLYTTDAGTTWQSDTFTVTALLDIEFLDHQTAFTAGYTGHAYYKPNASTWWQSFFPPEKETLTAVDFYSPTLGVAVGGKNFANGIIYRFNNLNGSTDTVHYPLDYELRDVQFTDQNTVHTVGYGYVGKSTDGGLTWTARDIGGDFFFALHFPSSQVGYAVGHSGTIIKTTDGGENWIKIRNGNNVLVSNAPFRDVYFVTENKGFIVGDDGLFWQTDNGGDSWKIIDHTPQVTFHSIFYTDGVGYITADEGGIYRFEE